MLAKDFFRTLDEITPIVDNHKTMVVLTGGEAILRKDIEQIGAEPYRREFPRGVVSKCFGQKTFGWTDESRNAFYNHQFGRFGGFL